MISRGFRHRNAVLVAALALVVTGCASSSGYQMDDQSLNEGAGSRGVLVASAGSLAGLGVTLASNVSLGVYSEASGVPVRTLMDAGATIALGADDPLLFLSRLTAQYETLREQGFDDAELAALASSSVEASFADEASKRTWKAEIQDWLAADPSNDDDAEAHGA